MRFKIQKELFRIKNTFEKKIINLKKKVIRFVDMGQPQRAQF